MRLSCRILIGMSLLATIVSTLRVYPHQLAYFNELSGGPENGYKHLLGSNLDWGQDLLFLKSFLSRSQTKEPIPVVLEPVSKPLNDRKQASQL